MVTWGAKKQKTLFQDQQVQKQSLGVLKMLLKNSSRLHQCSKNYKYLFQRPPYKILWCDNLEVVHLSANPILHSRTKHVEFRLKKKNVGAKPTSFSPDSKHIHQVIIYSVVYSHCQCHKCLDIH